MERGILLQRAMNARLIIIGGIPAQDPAQMRLPEYDYVVETFPADRADQPLHVRILPRRSGSGPKHAPEHSIKNYRAAGMVLPSCDRSGHARLGFLAIFRRKLCVAILCSLSG
jgi:hypothetical protein